MTPARQKDIRKIAHLIGNAAAHVVLYPDQYKRISEVLLYFGQAEEVTVKRTWNQIERCRELAHRQAASEIRKRTPADRAREQGEFFAKAQQEIDQFIEEKMR